VLNTTCDDSVKYNIIKNSWQPPVNFKFPFSTHNKKNREEKRYINIKHIIQHPWLAYSDIYKGLFCKYCVPFAENKQISVEKFVKKPLTTFAKLTGKHGELAGHEMSVYHKNSVAAADQFCKIFENPSKSILNLLDSTS